MWQFRTVHLYIDEIETTFVLYTLARILFISFLLFSWLCFLFFFHSVVISRHLYQIVQSVIAPIGRIRFCLCWHKEVNRLNHDSINKKSIRVWLLLTFLSSSIEICLIPTYLQTTIIFKYENLVDHFPHCEISVNFFSPLNTLCFVWRALSVMLFVTFSCNFTTANKMTSESSLFVQNLLNSALKFGMHTVHEMRKEKKNEIQKKCIAPHAIRQRAVHVHLHPCAGLFDFGRCQWLSSVYFNSEKNICFIAQ